MGTILKYAQDKGLIKDMPGGSVNWASALIDSGKTVSQVTLQSLTADEVNAICSKLDMLYPGTKDPSVAPLNPRQLITNMIAEELSNILTTVQVVKWQTQSAFGGILAQGTQLDIWPLRPKDVGGTLLSSGGTSATGLYGGTGAAVYSWLKTGVAMGSAYTIVPTQSMWQYAGMIFLGCLEKMFNPIIEGIQFTLAGIASPAQPVNRSFKSTFGENSEFSVTRLEKPVLIPPLKQFKVDIMPADSGDTNLELIGLVVAQSQNKSL